MNHVLAAILLFVVTIAWFLLALLPALRELIERTDIEPLRLSPEAADIRFFAHSFRRYVQENLDTLRRADIGHVCTIVHLERDIAWYASPASGTKRVFEGCHKDIPLEKLVAIAEGSVRVCDDAAISRELFAGGSLYGGARAVFRAMLVEQDASLGPETTVVRWADAGNKLTVGPNSTLWGRASAGHAMMLAEGTRFERLSAPRIVFGAAEEEDETARVARARRLSRTTYTTFQPPENASVSEGRWALEGDLHIPDGAVVTSDLVLTGALTMGRGAKIEGAVRANTIRADDHCVFNRSIVAEKHLSLGPNCLITGPIAVEGEAVLGDACHVGDVGDETTISAITIRVGRGVHLSGEIWARSLGMVGPAEFEEAGAEPRSLTRGRFAAKKTRQPKASSVSSRG
jgi:hypothetical protein